MKKLASLSTRLNVVMLIIYCLYFQAFKSFESSGEVVEAMELTKEILMEDKRKSEERIYNMSRKMRPFKSYFKYIDKGTEALSDYENRITEILSKVTDNQKGILIEAVVEYHEIL